MKRSEGIKGIILVECINRYIGKYRIRWDVQPKEVEEGFNAVTFYETELTQSFRPRLSDIKSAVLSAINADVDEKILSGFTWKGMSVWLSTENQFNYKAAYDLAVMSQGQSLPTVFKFGTTDNPVYYSFETLEDISDFYISAMAYINTCLAEGWKKKDSIDWSVYEEYLK